MTIETYAKAETHDNETRETHMIKLHNQAICCIIFYLILYCSSDRVCDILFAFQCYGDILT